MVTLQRNKVSEFDDDPELQVVRKELINLEKLSSQAPNSQSYYEGGPYLSDKIYGLKDKGTVKIKKVDAFDDGNSILPTVFNFTSLYLMMYIDVKIIGAEEGRGKINVTPLGNGLMIEAIEHDLYKKPQKGQLHAVKRVIYRQYEVDGMFDWMRFVQTLSPDGTLTIKIPTVSFNRYC